MAPRIHRIGINTAQLGWLKAGQEITGLVSDGGLPVILRPTPYAEEPKIGFTVDREAIVSVYPFMIYDLHGSRKITELAATYLPYIFVIFVDLDG